MLLKHRNNISLNLETSAVATSLKRSLFIPITKKGKAKSCSYYLTITLISHASRLGLKSFNLGLIKCEPRTSRCTICVLKRQRNQRPNCQPSLDRGEIKGIPEKYVLCFIHYAKTFDRVYHNKL